MRYRPGSPDVEAFFVSVASVAIAEIGDKTQLLSLLLASRFRKPWPIICGILIATLANHALAGAAGRWIIGTLGPDLLRWIVGVSFVMMAVWALVPDAKPDTSGPTPRAGVFLSTVVAFFLLEMGDQTPIAAVALGASYGSCGAVVIGTTAGMMLANVPVVIMGERAAREAPFRLVRAIAAALFLALGLYTLFGEPEGL